MGRRKSVAAQMYGAYKKHRKAKEQERKRAEREHERQARKLEREAEQEDAQRRQQAEQAERDKRRKAAEKARERKRLEAEQQKAEAERRREVARIEREEKQRTAADEKDRRRRTLEERQADADQRTEAVMARVAELDGLLGGRARHLTAKRITFEKIFNADGPVALADRVAQTIVASALPAGFPRHCEAAFAPEARELLIEYELPRQNVVPTEVSYRYVRIRDAIEPTARKDADIKKLYGQVVARLALRILAEVFGATPVSLVSGVVLNGYVAAKNKATGQPIRPCLVSVNATRDLFDELVLDEPELDPVLCLRHLNAIVSPHPYDLVPVRPVVQFDLSKYKFVEEMDVVAGLDSRPDLLDLQPTEFEHLIRRLFEAIGMKSWVTQASRDEGVDAVAVNEDPVVGGLCVIQAKRYSGIVGLEAVHALAGVMSDKAATKGILVTTSWFGKASRDFAARNGRMELITGRELKALLLEHLDLDVLIGLPKLPPGWERRDIS